MGAAVLLKQFESILGGPLDWQSRPEPERAPTGIAEIDSAIGGLPRGCLTAIVGPASSPHSAADAGVQLGRLLWVRCGHSAEHALKAADLLIQGGGFGLVVMDLGDTAPQAARRISLASWFRLRRAVEHTPTILVSLARQSNAKTCASLVIECGRNATTWSGARSVSRLLRGFEVRAQSTHRRKKCSPVFTARAI